MEEADRLVDELTWMRRQLARYRHRANWIMRIEPGDQPDGPAVLRVDYYAEDTHQPGRQLALTMLRQFGPYPDRDEARFAADLRDTVLHGVHGHELDESLYRDEVLLNDVHADPTRWHCSCGGVGPVAGDGVKVTWICPGCGTGQTRVQVLQFPREEQLP